jgi:ABC-type amino acid transport substrate-binding protein
MKRTLSKRRTIMMLCVALVLTLVATGCGNGGREEFFTSLDELQDKKIGIVLAAITQQIAGERFPNAEVIEFNANIDMVAALQSGQIDAFMVSYPTAFLSKRSVEGLTYIDEPLSTTQAAVGVRRGNTQLLDQVNAVLDELIENGTIEDMLSRWYNLENPNYEMPEIAVPTSGRELVIGVAANLEPASFLDSRGEIIGFDGELVRRIAHALNRPIRFEELSMAAYPDALESRRVDMVVSNFIINPALADRVYFSQPYFETPFMMVVRQAR